MILYLFIKVQISLNIYMLQIKKIKLFLIKIFIMMQLIIKINFLSYN